MLTFASYSHEPMDGWAVGQEILKGIWISSIKEGGLVRVTRFIGSEGKVKIHNQYLTAR